MGHALWTRTARTGINMYMHPSNSAFLRVLGALYRLKVKIKHWNIYIGHINYVSAR